MKKLLVYFFAALFIASCSNAPEPVAQASLEAFEFISDSIVLKNGTCETPEKNCYTISWNFYRLADSTDFSRYVNLCIRKAIAQNLEPATGNPEEIDSLITSMQRDHTEFMEEFPESGISAWFDESKTRILNNDSTLVSVEVFNSNYYGGAHPNSFSIYLNFIPGKNKVLEAGDMFSDIKKVTELVEREFRVERELTPESDLSEEGFFLDNGKFFLPAGIGFTKEEVIFHYNPYEIGPYVFGNTEVRIPREKLKDYLRI